ncbi:MAG: Holliday junction resolvase RuvX [Nitrospirae bacterium]|nr:Holliday junction resolvase RuvX [Nitrospirota bacterium]
MRILGLDIGDKRIGIAVSDELRMCAHGVKTIERKGIKEDIRQIKEICEEYGVEGIVAGLPINMDGTCGFSVQKVQDFVSLLKEQVSIPVNTWDERLSTVAAERNLIDADMSRKKRKTVIDKIAATIILQGYLDSRAHY